MVLERCCRPPSLASLGHGSGHSSSFTLSNIGEVTQRFPGSVIIPVAELSGSRSGLVFSCSAARFGVVIPSDAGCSEPVVLADPRFDRVFRSSRGRAVSLLMTPRGATPDEIALCSNEIHCRAVSGRATVDSPSDAVRARLRGKPLPRATWFGQRFIELDRSDLARFNAAVRTLIITRPTPYRVAERRTLRALARDRDLSGHLAAAWTSEQRSDSFAADVSGAVPWAPTASSTQWSIAAVASLLALLVVLGTGTVDALDRRRYNQRLELLGATPGQVGAAAALHAGLELGSAAILAVATVSALVAFGVHRYSTAVPDFRCRSCCPYANWRSWFSSCPLSVPPSQPPSPDSPPICDIGARSRSLNNLIGRAPLAPLLARIQDSELHDTAGFGCLTNSFLTAPGGPIHWRGGGDGTGSLPDRT